MTCCSCTLSLAVTVIEVSKLAESNEGLMCRMIMPGSDNARPTDLLQVCECDVCTGTRQAVSAALHRVRTHSSTQV